MSKGNMLLGHARGKVGDIVFSRVNGQQVTRARAAVVKNPQTEKQMIQRIILNTVIQAYSRMAEICDHSFEGIAVGQASMSKFMRENMANLRTAVSNYVAEHGSFEGLYAFTPKGLNMFTPNPWVIATGQLPQVQLASVSPIDGAEITITSAEVIPTYAEIIASLGLQRGDQLTFIGQELYTDGRAAFRFARVILDPRESDGTQASLEEPFLANGVVNKPSPRNEGSAISFSTEANKLIFDLGENSMFGAGVIVSREKADGSWLRSNASIALASDIPYTLVGAMDLSEALYYAMSGGIDLESDRYLNTIEKEGKGVVVYMQQEGRGIGLMNKIAAYKLQEEGLDTVDANIHLGFKPDERDYGCGAQMLRYLGIHKMRLLTNNPVKRVGLEAYGLEIVENVPIEVTPNPYNLRYLETKKNRMGHTLHLK